MAISQEQQQRGLEQLKNIRRKYFNTSSEAADWWDKLTPEWRGVVLHAAAVNSGLSVFKAHLSKCCWSELFERLDFRAMIQLRCGISRARLDKLATHAANEGLSATEICAKPLARKWPLSRI